MTTHIAKLEELVLRIQEVDSLHHPITLEQLQEVAKRLPDPSWAISPDWPGEEPPERRGFVTRIALDVGVFHLVLLADAPGKGRCAWVYEGEIEMPGAQPIGEKPSQNAT